MKLIKSLIPLALLASNLFAGIISPDGSAYTWISASSERSRWEAYNLFDQNLDEADDPGSGSDQGRSWTVRSSGATSVVEFELDQVYETSSFLYAQRQFNLNDDRDKFRFFSIWISSNA